MDSENHKKGASVGEPEVRCTALVGRSLQWLRARAKIAADLWREGRIERTECFRLEMDAALGRDSGPVEYKPNSEYKELIEDGWRPKRPTTQVTHGKAVGSTDC